MNYSPPNFKLKKKKEDDMERDIIYYHIAIQKIEQHVLNKQSVFINYIYIYIAKHKYKCPCGVKETNKLEMLRFNYFFEG